MYVIKKAEFVISKADGSVVMEGMPKLVVCGKSNVGKSSFINSLANNGKLARTSNEPGRTRLINYFNFNDDFVLVDLPGYGFARVSNYEKLKWKKMIEEFFELSESLLHIFYLVDIRHEPTDDDKIMYNYLYRNSLPFTIIATKSDKLSRVRRIERLHSLAAIFKVGFANIIPFSVSDPVGRDRVFSVIENVLACAKEITE